MRRTMRIVLPVLFLLLVAVQTVSAQTGAQTGACAANSIFQANVPWYCSQINQALTAYWIKWEPIALLAVFVSFGIASIIFGVGVLLRNERIRNFGVGEYYEAIASAMIVILFTFISAVMFGLIPGIATGPVNPYMTALNYISGSISSLNGEVAQLFNIAALDGFYLNIAFSFCEQGQPAVPYPNPACDNIPQLFSYAINGLFYEPAFTLIDLQFDILGTLYAEFWIVLLFMYIAIPVFLIPGVVLRSLLPTRGLGGMMIAVAIGFYLVLPLLFSVAYYFTNTQSLQCTTQATNALQEFGAGVGAQTNALNPNSPLVQTLSNIEVCMDSYWLSVLFYPSLIMALTYATILQISEFIGGMAQLSGRLRV